MVQEKVSLLHPQGKKGPRIDRWKYEAVRRCLLDCLAQEGAAGHSDLLQAAEEALQGKFQGSIRWYTEWVKLDLEAKGVIARVPQSRPQLCTLTAQAGGKEAP